MTTNERMVPLFLTAEEILVLRDRVAVGPQDSEASVALLKKVYAAQRRIEHVPTERTLASEPDYDLRLGVSDVVRKFWPPGYHSTREVTDAIMAYVEQVGAHASSFPLSFSQPWASLVTSGSKTQETRPVDATAAPSREGRAYAFASAALMLAIDGGSITVADAEETQNTLKAKLLHAATADVDVPLELPSEWWWEDADGDITDGTALVSLATRDSLRVMTGFGTADQRTTDIPFAAMHVLTGRPLRAPVPDQSHPALQSLQAEAARLREEAEQRLEVNRVLNGEVEKLDVTVAALRAELAKAETARDGEHRAFELERVRCNILQEERQGDAYIFTGAPEDRLADFADAQVLLISVGCMRDYLAKWLLLICPPLRAEDFTNLFDGTCQTCHGEPNEGDDCDDCVDGAAAPEALVREVVRRVNEGHMRKAWEHNGGPKRPEYEPTTDSQRLDYLIEECGEVLVPLAMSIGKVIAAAGKTGRWGLLSYNPELEPDKRETNAGWLRRELRDLQAAINRAVPMLDVIPADPRDVRYRDPELNSDWPIPDGSRWLRGRLEGWWMVENALGQCVWREEGVGDWHGSDGVDPAFAMSVVPIIGERNEADRRKAARS